MEGSRSSTRKLEEMRKRVSLVWGTLRLNQPNPSVYVSGTFIPRADPLPPSPSKDILESRTVFFFFFLFSLVRTDELAKVTDRQADGLGRGHIVSVS